MATVISKVSTNYNVSNEGETLVMSGSFNYTNKINDLRLDMNHFMLAFTQLNNIITDINEQVKD